MPWRLCYHCQVDRMLTPGSPELWKDLLEKVKAAG